MTNTDKLQRFNPAASMMAVKPTARPTYYDCGICGALHDARWDGDCRQDDARFTPDQLDAAHGAHGWDEIEMTEIENWRALARPMNKPLKGHKFQGTVMGFHGCCECGWKSATWYGKGARAKAIAEWWTHIAECKPAPEPHI